MPENRLAVLSLICAAVFWSTSGVLIKLVALSPLAIAGWRSLIAGMVILLLCRRAVHISWNRDVLIAAACVGLFCISFVVATKLHYGSQCHRFAVFLVGRCGHPGTRDAR